MKKGLLIIDLMGAMVLTACGTSTDGDNANKSLNEQAGQHKQEDYGYAIR